ncbi:hypothetical protein [Nocardioides ferulae]|uniref:hypothetical protein n=1 Tax=Nocardioides ferulae TaxID=2340821 RepID=UPI000F898BD6|nr:hypothetical protein [Nocardioides ferulae]
MTSSTAHTLRRATLAAVLTGTLALPAGAAGTSSDPVGSRAESAAPPVTALKPAKGWKVRELGALPCDEDSHALDVDRGVVVGASYAGEVWDPFDEEGYDLAHAFAYDVARGRMRDLGSLEGSGPDRYYGRIKSGATAVDSGTAVGWSGTEEGDRHAVAFDLETGEIRDLGTLPGGTSAIAMAIDGNIVVGTSDGTSDGTPDGTAFTAHAFAYDLDSGEMVDLGTLPGGTTAQAEGVSGSRVVGTSSTDGDKVPHAFVYELDTGVMTDLFDVVGKGPREAHDVNGDIVVGERLGRPGWPRVREAGLFDLATGTLRGLGVLNGPKSAAYAVDGGLVVGWAEALVDDKTTSNHAVVRPVEGGSWRVLPDPPHRWEGSSEAYGIDKRRAATHIVGSAWTRTNTRAALWAAGRVVRGKPPVVRGQAYIGHRLTVRRDSLRGWRPAGVKLRLHWLRGGEVIPGETRRTYRIRPADRDTQISVRVTGRKPGHAPTTMTSECLTAERNRRHSVANPAAGAVRDARRAGSTQAARPATAATRTTRAN